ncbi:hypothetical protein H6S82_24655 [Planktothrix sp. FACHB-1355]|uniref:Uncharacterized protein n=1 Tax=Aerosakkonema funiforme FACHB-1375 TaxID=2949571 RepID=A0A926VP77_9CYAN|nr:MULTISPECIES: hypothetical protein [Oscillatoriales]MBD2186104.1 hypothetical protein [Aerosakkonema funiforme FACHB-1375]MBD3562012.1 hypothetical protein [Planktothrix sp. FACHB-1355]
MMTFNDRPIELTTFETNYLLSSTGFLIRPVQPRPLGKSKESPLDGQWLAKPFMIDNIPLLLPSIADLPIECPWGKVGEILHISAPLVKLIIASIEVEQLSNISEEIARMTGISPLHNTTSYQAAIQVYLLQRWLDLKTDSWVWVIQTIPA